MVELLSFFIPVSLWAAFGLDGVQGVDIPSQTATLNIKQLQINVIVVTICNNWSPEKWNRKEEFVRLRIEVVRSELYPAASPWTLIAPGKRDGD
jgi:hypothetical protein